MGGSAFLLPSVPRTRPQCVISFGPRWARSESIVMIRQLGRRRGRNT
jgi:hypothetical protein